MLSITYRLLKLDVSTPHKRLFVCHYEDGSAEKAQLGFCWNRISLTDGVGVGTQRWDGTLAGTYTTASVSTTLTHTTKLTLIVQ